MKVKITMKAQYPGRTIKEIGFCRSTIKRCKVCKAPRPKSNRAKVWCDHIHLFMRGKLMPGNIPITEWMFDYR